MGNNMGGGEARNKGKGKSQGGRSKSTPISLGVRTGILAGSGWRSLGASQWRGAEGADVTRERAISFAEVAQPGLPDCPSIPPSTWRYGRTVRPSRVVSLSATEMARSRMTSAPSAPRHWEASHVASTAACQALGLEPQTDGKALEGPLVPFPCFILLRSFSNLASYASMLLFL